MRGLRPNDQSLLSFHFLTTLFDPRSSQIKTKARLYSLSFANDSEFLINLKPSGFSRPLGRLSPNHQRWVRTFIRNVMLRFHVVLRTNLEVSRNVCSRQNAGNRGEEHAKHFEEVIFFALIFPEVRSKIINKRMSCKKKECEHTVRLWTKYDKKAT